MSEHHWSQGLVDPDEPQALNDPSWYVYSWLAALPNSASRGLIDGQTTRLPALVGEIKQQLEASNPLAGQQSVYAHLLHWAIQRVDCVAVASALYGDEGEGYQ